MILWSCRDKVNFKIYGIITLTNSYNTHIVHYAQRIQITLQPCFWITWTSQQILPYELVWIFILSGSFMGTDEDHCQDSLQWSTWIERPSSRLHLRMDFFRLFPTYSSTVFRLTRVFPLSFLSDLVFLASCWACSLIL